jgi:hypothetical protein
MKKVRGMPITGSKTAMTPKAPILNDAKETSLDLEKRLKGRATQPFNNTGGAATTSANKGPKGAQPGPVSKPYANLQHSSPGARALPSGGAVGYSKLPNQSGQVNGRMGTQFPKKHRPNGAGFPSRRNASFYGE